MALEILGILEQNLDLVSLLHGELAGEVAELFERDEALGLVADVDDHLVVGDADDPAADDLALGQVAHAVVVQRDQLRVLLRRDGLLVVGRAASVFFCVELHKADFLLDLGSGSMCLSGDAFWDLRRRASSCLTI